MNLLKVQDVMQKLNVSRRTVYYWINQGILKPVRIGRICRFHPDDIDRLIEDRRLSAPPEKKILAIDDDILVRESIKPLLERAGYSVTVVPDGNTAVTLFDSQKAPGQDFDLILTDMRMSEKNGLETLAEIRKKRQAQGKQPIPEIVLTAYDDPEAEEQAKHLGVKEFILKPFVLEQFLNAVHKHVLHAGRMDDRV